MSCSLKRIASFDFWIRVSQVRSQNHSGGYGLCVRLLSLWLEFRLCLLFIYLATWLEDFLFADNFFVGRTTLIGISAVCDIVCIVTRHDAFFILLQ